MKMITDKQKKFINDIKGVITENGKNAIDALDLNKFTCYDASKLISGLLGLRDCYKAISRGVCVTSTAYCDEALDNVFNTISLALSLAYNGVNILVIDRSDPCSILLSYTFSYSL